MAMKYARITVIKLYIKYKVYEVYSEELILIKSFVKGIIPPEHTQNAKINIIASPTNLKRFIQSKTGENLRAIKIETISCVVECNNFPYEEKKHVCVCGWTRGMRFHAATLTSMQKSLVAIKV